MNMAATPLVSNRPGPAAQNSTIPSPQGPLGINMDSSLSEAKAPTPVFTITRPELRPPASAFIQSYDDFYQVNAECVQLRRQQTDDHILKLRELTDEHQKMLEANPGKMHDHLLWTTCKSVVGCVSSGVTTVLGISMVTTPGASVAVGWVLISSGILTISSMVASETGAWEKIANGLFPENEDIRSRFLVIAPAAVALAGTGLGIAGGVTALSQGVDIARQVPQAITAALGLIEGVTTLGASTSSARLHFTAAQTKELDLAMFLNQTELHRFTTSVSHTLSVTSQGRRHASRLLAIAQESYNKAIRV